MTVSNKNSITNHDNLLFTYVLFHEFNLGYGFKYYLVRYLKTTEKRNNKK